jgi:hypothetical protein
LRAVEELAGEGGGNDEFRMANFEEMEISLEAEGGGAGGAGVGLAGCFSCHAGILLMKAGDESEGKA